MREGDAVPPPGDLAGSDEPITAEDVDRLLARAALDEARPPAVLRSLRDDLTVVLDVLGVAGEILSSDVAVLRRLEAAGRTGGARPEQTRDVVAELPRILAARPWGRGWSAPRATGEDERPEILDRSAPLWRVHDMVARVDVDAPAQVAAALARIQAQLVTLSEWRVEAEGRLGEVRAAIVREWGARVDRSLDTPA